MGGLADDFKVEYSPSGRAKCGLCRSVIDKDTLRIGVLTQSSTFDGEYYAWHHVACFFKKRPDVSSVSALKGFSLLRPKDQPKIQKLVADLVNSQTASGNQSKASSTTTSDGTDDSDSQGKSSSQKDKKATSSLSTSSSSSSSSSSSTASGGGLADDFKIEYAKSARSKCKLCNTQIDKDSIRIGILVQASTYDGEHYSQHHVKCFFEKRPDVKTVSVLKGFDLLRPADKPKVKRFTNEKESATGKRKNDEDEVEAKDDHKAKKARSTKKEKSESEEEEEDDEAVNPAKLTVTELQRQLRRRQLETSGRKQELVERLREALEEEGATSSKSKSKSSSTKKKSKKGSDEDEEGDSEASASDGGEGGGEGGDDDGYVEKLWMLKDRIMKRLSTAQMKSVLKKNGQHDRGGPQDLSHKIAEGYLKGAVPICPKCKNGALHYEEGVYRCKHQASEWSSCTFTAKDGEIERDAWKNPSWWGSTMKDAAAIKRGKGVKKTKQVASKSSKRKDRDEEAEEEKGNEQDEKGKDDNGEKNEKNGKRDDEGNEKSKNEKQEEEKKEAPKRVAKRRRLVKLKEKQKEEKVKGEEKEEGGKKEKAKEAESFDEEGEPIFDDITFVLLGDLSRSHDDWKCIIKLRGGTVSKKVKEGVRFVICTEEGVAAHQDQVKKAVDVRAGVLSEDFLVDSLKANEVEDQSFYRLSLRKLEREEGGSSQGSQGSQTKKEEGSGKMKVIRKGRGAVDALCEKAADLHVLEEGPDVFSAMLNLTDVNVGQRGRNSFYCLQLLEHDTKAKWFIFRRWGRIGTDGGKKKDPYDDRDEALTAFKELYFDKTGNKWKNRHNFSKKPGKFYPVEVDIGDEDAPIKLADVTKATGSKLHPSVQQLVSLIFDIRVMKKALTELEIDLQKMPLGKLKRERIAEGYALLQQVETVLDAKGMDDDERLLKLTDLTNQFFTLIPQDFGEAKPPLIDSFEVLKHKMDILEALQDIEIATGLLQTEDGNDSANAIDESFAKLRTSMEPLDRDSDEFRAIKRYAEEGHDRKYFSEFKRLEVLDVFKIAREGAEETFKEWKGNANRQLLWHGSRLSNFVGILSQGLRIAPPEAPKTGYRFGKGIYFADCVSKSASYCYTSSANPIGLMLLNEVALGRMCELHDDLYMEKPQKGSDSTKALGATAPDPKQTLEWNGVKVPCGPPKKTGIDSSCSHNEYIVYSIKQVCMRYLLKIKFHHGEDD